MKPYKSLLLLAIIIPILTQAKDTVRVSHKFADKVVHSFSIQYNNAIRPPGHFNYHCDPALGWAPLCAYGNEYSIGYQFVTQSGFGGDFEVFSSIFGMRVRNNASSGISDNPYFFLEYAIPYICDYFGLKAKATYTHLLSNRVFIQPSLGLSFPFYVSGSIQYGKYSSFSNPERTSIMYVSNGKCIRKWVPDLLFGIDFLFHTKRNPRNNFILGVNANIGFVPRYKGYFSLQPPFDRHDCDITYGSSYFGINLGYAFLGLPKTFFRKKYRKELEYSTFDLNSPTHAVSLSINNGFAVGGKIVDKSGPINPAIACSYTPEITLKYSCTLQKGLGFSVGIPLGLFRRTESMSLFGAVPADTIWANGTQGYALSDNYMTILRLFSGLSVHANYLKKIHRNMFVQSELGLSLRPMIYRAELLNDAYGDIYIDAQTGEYVFEEYYLDYILQNNDGSGYNIPYAYEIPKFHQKGYWLPNLSGAVNFLVHGKNPCHNLVFGLNFNVDFAKRMTIDYATVPSFPDKYKSSGKMVFNMTTIGLHIGYQFMTGRKQAIGNK